MELNEILVVIGAAAVGVAAVTGAVFYAVKALAKEFKEFAATTASQKDDAVAAKLDNFVSKVYERVDAALEKLPDGIERQVRDAFNKHVDLGGGDAKGQ